MTKFGQQGCCYSNWNIRILFLLVNWHGKIAVQRQLRPGEGIFTGISISQYVSIHFYDDGWELEKLWLSQQYKGTACWVSLITLSLNTMRKLININTFHTSHMPYLPFFPRSQSSYCESSKIIILLTTSTQLVRPLRIPTASLTHFLYLLSSIFYVFWLHVFFSPISS